jgi:short-subunit dehydrogenase
MTFKNKICWITGASSGIGEALAFYMANEGAKLIVSARNESKLLEIKDQCSANGASSCDVIPMDLANPTSINEAFGQFRDLYNSIDYLVNNGGISQRAYAHEASIDIDRQIMEVNFFGSVALSKLVLPIMLEQGRGNISVTSSITGKFGFPLRTAYSASKHAVQGFFESLRTEVQSKGVSVSIIIPGRVKTEISKHALEANGKEHGKMDDGQNEGISADKAAKIIGKGLLNRKREILVGGKELNMVHIRRFLPALFYKIVARIKHT